MPLGILGGVSSEESRLLGGGMEAFGEATLDSAIYGDDRASGTSCAATFFGLSTGEEQSATYSQWLIMALGCNLSCNSCNVAHRHNTG